MSIFPPRARGGVPPGPNVCNAYTPTHAVIGEGPSYISPDCTTTLTDCQLNGITSEILAAVDCLGYAYNANRVDNLCTALQDRFASIELDRFVNRSGDTMTGPLEVVCPPVNDNDAACRRYVDDTARDAAEACCTAVRGEIATIVDGLQADINNRVRRDGDQMTGPLILSGDPTSTSNPNQAATKNYVDMAFGSIIVAPEPPTGVLPNRLWWDSSIGGGGLFVRFDDGDSVQWVQIGGGRGPQGPPGLSVQGPPGADGTLTIVQTTQPPTTGATGSLWFNPSNGRMSILYGGSWHTLTYEQ